MKFKYLVESCVANNTDLRKKEAETIIRGIFKDIGDALANGESISIRGFGTFKPVQRKARTVKEPRGGKLVKIPARVYPRFTPSPSLKELVNGD